jgi:hypothetical protein
VKALTGQTMESKRLKNEKFAEVLGREGVELTNPEN